MMMPLVIHNLWRIKSSCRHGVRRRSREHWLPELIWI